MLTWKQSGSAWETVESVPLADRGFTSNRGGASHHTTGGFGVERPRSDNTGYDVHLPNHETGRRLAGRTHS
jgi:hypothetical protein